MRARVRRAEVFAIYVENRKWKLLFGHEAYRLALFDRFRVSRVAPHVVILNARVESRFEFRRSCRGFYERIRCLCETNCAVESAESVRSIPAADHSCGRPRCAGPRS